MKDAKRTVQPRLIPLRVPWQVSPSTPFLSIHVSEEFEVGSTWAEFVAYFAIEDKSRVATDGRSVKLVARPNVDELDSGSGPYQLLRVTFDSGLWVRVSPAWSDSEVVKESDYDWTSVPCGYEPGQDISVWLRHFRDTWTRESICPDPRIYEVHGSRWLDELGQGRATAKHILILGHDSYGEIIAEGWRWVSRGVLRHW